MKIIVTLIEGENEVTVIEAESGNSLYSILAQNGVHLNAPCGGRGKCGKCVVSIQNRDEAKERNVLACQTVLDKDCTIRLSLGKSSILTKGQARSFQTDSQKGLALAFDIGTTTIAAYLLDTYNGEQLAASSLLNPQQIHGADVISRMSYASKSRENRGLLQIEILNALETAREQLLNDAELPTDSDIQVTALVGNTAMMHLLSNLDTNGISKAPYLPEYTVLHRRCLNKKPHILGGCISGYVGADTVAAMLACEFDKATDNVLLIDIGTNGEIALKSGDGISCCSCAAGPAFEGTHISCGTGAVTGAIDHLFKHNDGFEYTTINNGEAIGICGSGLVDAVAYLIDSELITPVGRMKDRLEISKNVYIDPADIREVQLAKAAIAAGIEILADRAGLTYDEIDRVLLAGGFGNYINVRSACQIGLLPKELESKVTTVGNAAGDGAKMLALSKKYRAAAESLRMKTKYIELSAQDDFEDIYTDNLIFEVE